MAYFATPGEARVEVEDLSSILGDPEGQPPRQEARAPRDLRDRDAVALEDRGPHLYHGAVKQPHERADLQATPQDRAVVAGLGHHGELAEVQRRLFSLYTVLKHSILRYAVVSQLYHTM